MLRARAARAVLAVGISVLMTLMSTGSAQAGEPTTYPVRTTTMVTAQANGSGAQSAPTSGLAVCPANNICFYEGQNYTDAMWSAPLPNNTVYCYEIPYIDFNYPYLHRGLSVYNNTGGRFIIYLANPCSLFTVQVQLGPYEGWAGQGSYEAWWYKRECC